MITIALMYFMVVKGEEQATTFSDAFTKAEVCAEARRVGAEVWMLGAVFSKGDVAVIGRKRVVCDNGLSRRKRKR